MLFSCSIFIFKFKKLIFGEIYYISPSSVYPQYHVYSGVDERMAPDMDGVC
jgi:hypothetical protein